MNGNEPVWKVSQGGLSAAAWKNSMKLPSGQTVERLSVRVERRYKNDKTGQWESTSSFSLPELYRLQHFVGRVIDRALAEGQEEAGEVA